MVVKKMSYISRANMNNASKTVSSEEVFYLSLIHIYKMAIIYKILYYARVNIKVN